MNAQDAEVMSFVFMNDYFDHKTAAGEQRNHW